MMTCTKCGMRGGDHRPGCALEPVIAVIGDTISEENHTVTIRYIPPLNVSGPSYVPRVMVDREGNVHAVAPSIPNHIDCVRRCIPPSNGEADD